MSGRLFFDEDQKSSFRLMTTGGIHAARKPRHGALLELVLKWIGRAWRLTWRAHIQWFQSEPSSALEPNTTPVRPLSYCRTDAPCLTENFRARVNQDLHRPDSIRKGN